jgi:hypothetical protein
MVEAIASAPADASAMQALGAALVAVGDFFDDGRRTFARQRHAVIAANAELHERELMKLAALSAALASALRAREVDEEDASLVAECGIAIFHVVFRRWVARGEKRSFKDLALETLDRWQALAGARPRRS